jgi:hypothetical protein
MDRRNIEQILEDTVEKLVDEAPVALAYSEEEDLKAYLYHRLLSLMVEDREPIQHD